QQDADGERELLLLGEVLDGLGDFVFGDGAVGFREVGDEAVLVARGEEYIHEVDVDVDGRGVDVGDRLRRGVALGWRRADRGGLLRGEGTGAEGQRQKKCGRGYSGKEAEAHGLMSH